jgi:hypothetical protein
VAIIQCISQMDDMQSGQREGQQRQRPMQQAKNPRHSSSYPRVPALPSTTRPLLSVQSEGSNMKRMGDPKQAGDTAAPEAGQRRSNKALEEDDNSSDESGGEEVIVRVDSPSMLSFRQPRDK